MFSQILAGSVDCLAVLARGQHAESVIPPRCVRSSTHPAFLTLAKCVFCEVCEEISYFTQGWGVPSGTSLLLISVAKSCFVLAVDFQGLWQS